MMLLGSDVSRLSTSAADAAAQGLSIVVPVYNEAAGLELLHRIGPETVLWSRRARAAPCDPFSELM